MPKPWPLSLAWRFNFASASRFTSGVTSNPTSRGHCKTGQLSASRTTVFTLTLTVPASVFAPLSFSECAGLVYTGLTWAEDRATQGCDRSADPAAGMAGRRQPPYRKQPFWRQSGKSPGLGTESPIKKAFLPIRFWPGRPTRRHPHCALPAAVAAVLVRQLRGPHLSTCP